MGELLTRIKANIIERRQRIEQGKINSIPSPFVRFRNDFLGIERKKMYLISSYTKGSKTQFTTFMFVINPLLYTYHNRDKARVKFFFYLWEETKEDFTNRLICHLLYKISRGKVEVSPSDLLSSNNDKPLSDEALAIMDSPEFIDIIDYFEQCSVFSDSQNPTGIFMECKSYAEENGTTHYKKKIFKDEFGIEKEVNSFDYYEPNDTEEYRIIYIDHLSLVSSEKNYTLKQSMDKVGEYCVSLRNRYFFSPVIIQQQNTDNESMDAIKLNKLRPTVAGLSDSKYSARNCDVFLGLFSPVKFDLREYYGYNITKFKDNIRFLEVILNRGGQMGGLTALYFNGAVCDFQQLPLPNETEKIQKWYDFLSRKNVKSFFMKILKNTNKLTK